MYANEWQEISHCRNGDWQRWPLQNAILAVAWTQAQVVNSNSTLTGKETQRGLRQMDPRSDVCGVLSWDRGPGSAQNGVLYSEIQCIMGKWSHVTPHPDVKVDIDRKKWKHYFPQLHLQAVNMCHFFWKVLTQSSFPLIPPSFLKLIQLVQFDKTSHAQ